MIEMLLAYALLSAALFYLGSRALITQWLWSSYSPRFSRFMDCAACTGFWWGFILSLTFRDTFGELPKILTLSEVWRSNGIVLVVAQLLPAIIVGLWMIVLTPIVAGVMQRGLDMLGTIATDDKGDN